MPTLSPPTRSNREVSTEEIIVGEHLAELRGRIRLLTWAAGLGWSAVVFVGGFLVLGGLDWLVHFDNSGTRLLVALGLLAASVCIIWRSLVVPLKQPLTDSFLASCVERTVPGLNHSIVSA